MRQDWLDEHVHLANFLFDTDAKAPERGRIMACVRSGLISVDFVSGKKNIRMITSYASVAAGSRQTTSFGTLRAWPAAS